MEEYCYSKDKMADHLIAAYLWIVKCPKLEDIWQRIDLKGHHFNFNHSG